jgi:hypothetical protein
MKKLIIVLTLLLLVPAYAFGVEVHEAVSGLQTTLKEAMQNHLSQMQRLLSGIMYQNSYAAAQSALGIAMHPIPAEGTAKASAAYFIVPEQRKAFAKMQAKFVESLHDVAGKLEEAAKKEDWDTSLQLYHDMLNACTECHKYWKKYSIDNVILERNKEEISKMKKTIVQ